MVAGEVVVDEALGCGVAIGVGVGAGVGRGVGRAVGDGLGDGEATTAAGGDEVVVASPHAVTSTAIAMSRPATKARMTRTVRVRPGTPYRNELADLAARRRRMTSFPPRPK